MSSLSSFLSLFLSAGWGGGLIFVWNMVLSGAQPERIVNTVFAEHLKSVLQPWASKHPSLPSPSPFPCMVCPLSAPVLKSICSSLELDAALKLECKLRFVTAAPAFIIMLRGDQKPLTTFKRKEYKPSHTGPYVLHIHTYRPDEQIMVSLVCERSKQWLI